MIVAIVIGAVLVLLVVVMKWADRRDRAKGHVNRGMGEVRAIIRRDRLNVRALRGGGGPSGVPSPHQLRRRQDRFRRR